MSEEIGLVYLNLSLLLDDICAFLRDGVNKEVFPAETQKKAETLIKRSKIQLQHISNITNGECYMQMEEQKKEDEVEDEELIYNDAEEEKMEKPVDINDICPFAGVPARDLPLDDKCGFIYMKTKFIFGFEKLKRIYAVIHMDWFLIYCNERDSKPSYTYCLRFHKAQMIPTTKQGEHETQLFSLVNLETKQKWQFIAQTHKDMLQWIARMNTFHPSDDRQPNETKKMTEVGRVPEKTTHTNVAEDSEDEEEHYDMVILKVNDNKNIVQLKEEEVEEDDEIYEVIRPQSPDDNQHSSIPKPSELSTLPTRRQQTPLPPLPVDRQESTESLETYDNPALIESWDKQSKISETHSFSESEEQEIYDVVIMTSQVEQEREEEKTRTFLRDSAKKEEMRSPRIFSLKEKLLQSSTDKPHKEKPVPPKKLSNKKQFPDNSSDSPTKENFQITYPIRKPFKAVSSINSPIPPVSFPKPSFQPKPQTLTKPKIEVKIIKPPANTKSSTKQVMKLAKEISMK